MNYSYIFICFIFTAISSSSFAQSSFLKQEQLRHNVFFHLGADMEKTPSIFDRKVGDIYNLNLAFGYSWVVKRGWALQPSIGFQQFATPPVRLARVFRFDTDTDRILVTDTVSVNRLSGFSASLVLAKEVRWGITFRGGLYMSKYKWALVEKSSSTARVPLGPFDYGAISRSGSYRNGYTAIPDWVQREQVGLQLGIEKSIVGPLYIGASVHKGLRDMTPKEKSVKNYPTNTVLYLGLRMGLL
jgi:hypothetical protein